MKLNLILRSFLAVSVLASLTLGTAAQTAVSEKDVRTHMEFLASDELRGRGSGTEDERKAGEYFAKLMKSYKIEPAGDKDASGKRTFMQTINSSSTVVLAPFVKYSNAGSEVKLENGKQMAVLRVTGLFKGPLERTTIDGTAKAGSVALVSWREGDDQQRAMQKLQAMFRSGVAGILVQETAQWRSAWTTLGSRPVSISQTEGVKTETMNIITISKEAAEAMSSLADGTEIEFGGNYGASVKRQTWNAVGKISGSDSTLKSEVVLLSAHMDHLGVRPNAPGDDKIYNGADDDASGCTAVIELARVLAKGKKPKRTVYFAFFGSEEAGGTGSRYFVSTLPFPKENLVANLQFEMLGRPDEKVQPGELWLTGYDRSDLGVTLAKRGARLVADPHPDQNFFQRSDNYTLARQGIVAHTVSSFGLHKDYHQPSDEIDTIDFKHMTQSIQSMVAPVKWLVNSDFKPTWYEGKRP